jgi:hypothetical protein
MGGKEHLISAPVKNTKNTFEICRRIFAGARTLVPLRDKTRKAAETEWAGIAHADTMAG